MGPEATEKPGGDGGYSRESTHRQAASQQHSEKEIPALSQ